MKVDLTSAARDLDRLEIEKGAASSSLRVAMKNLADRGVDLKVLAVVRKLERMTPYERREWLDLQAIYLTHLGINDNALPETAKDRLTSRDPHEEGEQAQTDLVDELRKTDPPPRPEPPPAPEETDEQAFERGRVSHTEGRPITSNPFGLKDKRSIAWERGWCMSAGTSDGMDIPKAFQRRKKKKKKDGEPDDDTGADDAGK